MKGVDHAVCRMAETECVTPAVITEEGGGHDHVLRVESHLEQVCPAISVTPFLQSMCLVRA